MAKPDDDDELLAVAASISDGTRVDWEEARRRFAGSDAARILEELRLLDGLAAAHTDASTWGSLEMRDALGGGSFATVYRAFDPELQREVALKISTLHGSPSFDPQQVVREARLLARVRHPNVVTVFGAQHKDDAVAIEMELIKGQTLERLVESQGPLSAHETAVIGLDLCRALAAVHEAGLLHGDIKAHNVMREAGGRIVLMDFGTGKDLKAPAPPRGDFAGTPLYLAPEVFAGQPRTIASDIYSLGVLLYYLSTADYPVGGATRSEVDQHHKHASSRKRLRDARPDLPEAFVHVVERAAAEDAAERYQTAGELEAALRAVLRDKTSPWLRNAALAAAGLLTVALAGRSLYSSLNGKTEGPHSAPSSTAAATVANSSYRIDAAFYRAGPDGSTRLRRTDHVGPGDKLFLQVKTSIPAFVYVVNEDEAGHTFVGFPLPGQMADALPANTEHRLPGVYLGEERYWQVNTPGGHEHFILFASPRRLPDAEELVASLPKPRLGAPISYSPLTRNQVVKLRGLGGLATAPDSTGKLSARYTTPLRDAPEDIEGTWIRHIAFANPAR